MVDEETDAAGVADGSRAVIGGLVAGKTVKTTRTNQLMAFITLEDLLGPVEVIVFPRDYEANRDLYRGLQAVHQGKGVHRRRSGGKAGVRAGDSL